MDKTIRRLPDAELEVMQALWALDTYPAHTADIAARLERDSLLAVVPIGYGDGYPRSLSNRMTMKIHGAECPIVGRVCMDMCMVDVTDLPDVAPGDVARIYGPGLTQRAADQAETIVYELLCQLSRRVPRIYLDGGREIR